MGNGHVRGKPLSPPHFVLRHEFYGSLLYRNRSIVRIGPLETAKIFQDWEKFGLQACIKRLMELGLVFREDSALRIIKGTPVDHALSGPIKVFIDLTNQCNLRCLHCLSNSSPEGTTRLSLETIRHISNQCYDMGVFTVKLGGGECLLLPDFWQIVEQFTTKGIDVSFSTNGVLVDQEVVERAKQYDTKVTVSIDGQKETHEKIRGNGTFEEATRALCLLKRSGVRVALGMTLFPINLDDVSYIMKLSNNINVPLKIRRCKPQKRSIESELIIKEITPDYRKAVLALNNGLQEVDIEDIMNLRDNSHHNVVSSLTDCGAGRRSLHINESGDITPCVFLGDEFISGNIQNLLLTHIWRYSDKFKTVRNIKLNPTCTKCVRRMMCHGECLAIRKYTSGSFGGIDPCCPNKLFHEEYNDELGS